MGDEIRMQPTTEERMVEACTAVVRKELCLMPVGGGYGHIATVEGVFLCRELDDIRRQLAKALGQLGMLGLPEAPPEGAHVHRKVFSGVVMGWERAWICSECLEEGIDNTYPKGPTYNELVDRKRERGGG